MPEALSSSLLKLLSRRDSCPREFEVTKSAKSHEQINIPDGEKSR